MFLESKGIKSFKSIIWLTSPTIHRGELDYMTKTYEINWMSTVGENINEDATYKSQEKGPL